MELLYIWVKEYRSIKEQGINLSSKFIFNLTFNFEENGLKGELEIVQNPNYIHNFFERENLREVTALIGKNGTGKSSILDYIKERLPEGLLASFRNDILAISERKFDEVESYKLLAPNNYSIKLNDKTGLFVLHNYTDDLSNYKNTIKGHLSMLNTKYIFYSNSLRFSDYVSNFNGLKNISTTVLLINGRKRNIEEKWGGELTIASTEAFTSDLENFKREEILKGMLLVTSKQKLRIPFKLPNVLKITISSTEKSYFEFNKNHKDKVKNLEFKKIVELIKLLEQANENIKNKKERAVNNLFIATYINNLVSRFIYSSYIGNILQPKLNHITIQEYIIEYFSGINTFRSPGQIEIGKETIDFLYFIKELINLEILEIWSGRLGGQFDLVLKISDNTINIFERITQKYMRIKGLTDFIFFEWDNLSNGEQSFLSLMSRFYYLKHHEIGHDTFDKNLIILIDEGDIGYHPEWQRKFLNDTLNYLSNLFFEHKLQIIFASNAPFITSDLPKSNIIFIEKNLKGETQIHGKENDRAETFGGNIHNLFADSFYMEGALMGEFAKDKINKIIEYLNGKPKQMREDYRKTIDLIGEPILRRKLQEMWYEKFGDDEEIIELQKRIEVLKKKKLKKE